MAKTVWDVLQEQFLLQCVGEIQRPGLVKLIVALIVSAGRDRDAEYLNSDDFEYDCNLVGLDCVGVYSLFKNAWRCIDTNSKMNLDLFDTINNPITH